VPQIAWPSLPGTGVARFDDRLRAVTANGSPPPIRATVAATWALFVGIMMITAGNGLQFTTIGVRSTLEDFSALAIGIVTAGYYAGFLLGARFTFRALGRVGHLRVFGGLASSASASVLLHSLWIHPVSWSLMRFVTGFCMAGVFIVAESWINDRATNDTRGMLMATYMVIGIGGRAAGQGLLNLGDPEGFDLFVMSSVLVSMALVPMMMSASSAPPIVQHEPISFREMREVVPTGLITIFVAGLTTATLGGLTAVYGTKVGMGTGELSLFISALMVGAVVLQIPIGHLSDRFRRRIVMLVVAGGAAGIATTLALVASTGWVPLVLIALLGGLTYPLYGLGVAYTNDWIPSEKRAGASMILMIVNGVGAIIGPLVAALAMSTTAAGLFWTIVVVQVVFAGYLFVRIVIRAPVPVDRQTRFTPLSERATAMILRRK